MTNSMTPIVLKVYDGGTLRSTRSFESASIKLGSAGTEVVDANALHATIDRVPGGVILRAPGIEPLQLNGQPILAAPLRHGDVISFGDLRVVVELTAPAPAAPHRAPRLQLIQGEEAAPVQVHPVLREAPRVRAQPVEPGHGGLEQGARATAIAPALPPPPPARKPKARPVAQMAALPVRLRPLPSIPASALQGGECAEVELFWGDTRVSVWQLLPGEEFLAGTEPGCNAMLQGLTKAKVLTSDVNGWTLSAPRPLTMTLEEDGKAVGGAELLVRGKSQTDSAGLVVALPQKGVAVLYDGALALRIRRVRAIARAPNERTDWKAAAVICAAAVVLMIGMKLWSGSLREPRPPADGEILRSRPVAVRSVIPPIPTPPKEKKAEAQGRKDPGIAVARHLGIEGEAGLKTAPRRDARAERKTDDKALVAQSGLLKALGAGKGQGNVFGVALEKGAKDAMGHLTGPRVADAHGDGGMGLKSLGGKGGGGDGSGLGLARIGTNGIGGGLADYGNGKGGLKGKESGDIGLGPGKPEVIGSIDPELIRKVVHDHRAQIRTCYETQLTMKSSLAGKVISAWTIDQAGAVTESHTQESSLHDKTVEACVNAKIKTWRFPIPKGGGEVFVTYPFIFTPGG